MLTPELELQAFEGFTDWFKHEYGIDLTGGYDIQTTQQSLSPSWAIPKASRAIQMPKIQSNKNYQEVIQKIASILVDMVIDEQKSLKSYD